MLLLLNFPSFRFRLQLMTLGLSIRNLDMLATQCSISNLLFDRLGLQKRTQLLQIQRSCPGITCWLQDERRYLGDVSVAQSDPFSRELSLKE